MINLNLKELKVSFVRYSESVNLLTCVFKTHKHTYQAILTLREPVQELPKIVEVLLRRVCDVLSKNILSEGK